MKTREKTITRVLYDTINDSIEIMGDCGFSMTSFVHEGKEVKIEVDEDWVHIDVCKIKEEVT